CITCIEKYKAGIDKQVYKFYLKHMYLLAKQLNAEEEVMKYYSEELTQFPEEEKLIKCLKNQDYNFNYKVQIVNEIK
ncbi:MAG: hypothetical protein LIO65_07625, partial [Odoribacter sp.]|nr:hypothetical protein [Odoribacter sp.]